VQPQTAPGTQAAMQMIQQAGVGGATPGGAGGGMPGVAGVAPPPAAAPGTAAPSGGAAGAAGNPAPAPQTGQAASNVLSPQAGGAIGRGGANELELPPIRVVADEKNNSLVIFARPRDFRMIYEAIRQLDVVPLQVLLEATVAEVTLNDSLNYGLQFFLTHGSTSASLTTSTTGTQSSTDIAEVFPGYNYVLNGNPRVILNALSSLTHVNVISSPQLLVVDHQTAALQVGDQVPVITQSAQSVLTTGAPLVSNVQYLSTGVVLQITPRVNTNGLVTLDIDQQVSDVETTTTSTINSPTINQRRIVTSVIVQDGQTVALGGLIQDTRQQAKSGLPLLSDIPVFGSLFGTTTNSTARTELLVLVSPKIIRNGQDAHDMTEDLRNRMRTLKPLDVRVR
jgi:general secretion pathway protein D